MDNEIVQPVEAKKKGYRALSIFVILVIAISAIIYGTNYLQLQSRMNKVLSSDQRNKGIEVSVHFENYINPNVLVYDLKSASGNNSKLDVFRVLLQFSESVKEKKYDSVLLNFNGSQKFKLEGVYFNRLGKEYSEQNPMYTLRTFPENLKKIDNTPAYSQWSGGILGVLQKQMDDFNDFNKKWYLDDLSKNK